MAPSPTVEVFAQSTSEFAALHGHKAKTPIIAGAISGGAVGVAWIIGFIVYFFKRHRRERRAIAAGYRSHREMLDPPKKQEAFIIPPDPAIVEGTLEPGDRAVDCPGAPENFTMQHSWTVPLSDREKQLIDESEKVTPTDTPTAASPELTHSMSEPGRPSHASRLPSINSTTTFHPHYPPHAHPDHT